MCTWNASYAFAFSTHTLKLHVTLMIIYIICITLIHPLEVMPPSVSVVIDLTVMLVRFIVLYSLVVVFTVTPPSVGCPRRLAKVWGGGFWGEAVETTRVNGLGNK